jgi:POT family proton-dependent oligopeptide transporter
VPVPADTVGWWAGWIGRCGHAVSWSLIQFNGRRLDGYGERPEAPIARSLMIYAAAIFVPVVYFLFTT